MRPTPSDEREALAQLGDDLARTGQSAPKATRQRGRTKSRRAPKGWQKAFLRALEKSTTVTAACEAASVSRGYAYRVKANVPAFARLWESAIQTATDGFEKEAERRAVEGVRKLVIHKGEVVFIHRDAEGNIVPADADGEKTCEPLYESEYSDRLLELVLKANRGEKFRERYDVNVTKSDGVDEEIRNLTAEMKSRVRAGDAVPVE